MATPPKSRSRKPRVGSATAAKVPVKAAPGVPLVIKPQASVSKPVAQKAEPVTATPAIAKAAKAAPVVKAARVAVPQPAPVEWPVAGLKTKSESVSELKAVTPTPLMAPAIDLLKVAVAKTKGDTIMTDAIETAKSFAEEAKTRMQSAFSEANDKAKAALEKSSKAFEELGELTKGNLEAVVESSKIAAKGVESLGQEAADFSRKSFEKTSATMKSFAAVKSPAEFFQLQSDLLSATLDSFASAASKNSEAFLKLASDVSQPISNRVSVVTEKMKSLAA